MPTDHKIQQEIESKHNIARFCVENTHVSWALFVAVFLWGFYGYQQMPKSKDPDIPVRIAMVATPWPGHDAMEIEELVTRQVEQKIAENQFLYHPDARSFSMKSLTLPGVSLVQVQLAPGTDRDKAFNELGLNLNSINDQLPEGAGPISLNSQFGDTAAVMLAVASPKADSVEIALRAQDIGRAIEDIRGNKSAQVGRAAVVVAVPLAVDPGVLNAGFLLFRSWLDTRGLGSDFELLRGAGYIGIDFATTADDAGLLDATEQFLYQRLGGDRFYPDAWRPIVVRDAAGIEARLTTAVGDKYSYRQLDDFSSAIAANLKTVPQVSRVLRSGVLNQQVNLTYSQEVLAAYGVLPSRIGEILTARNTTVPGGVLQVQDMNVVLNPTGDFVDAKQIGDVIITRTDDGTPVYLRSLVDVRRGYQSPPQLLSFYTARDDEGEWQRTRAVNLAVQMHIGEQIAQLGEAIAAKLRQVRQTLPDDLIIERVSDQPTQVKESVDLFMTALYEAIILVVLIALIGFREWRSALLLMISIPITLAMTFGFMSVLGITIQQVSVAALIIALGLLVDDPVVASDAIKRGIADGQSRSLAAWLGPTLIASAIFFATLTNVVAYLPFLLLTGNQGDFLHSLPIVMASALIASRIVSMTFVPLLGSMILRPERRPTLSIEQRRTEGFTGKYYKLAGFAIDHRKKFLIVALGFLVLGFGIKSQLKDAFFPDDVQYLSTIDIWLKNDANMQATNDVAVTVERLVRDEIRAYAKSQGHKDESTMLEAISTTVGGGAPRFWFTVTPQQRQTNYAQLIVRVNDKDLTPILTPKLQIALISQVPGAHIDVKQLQTTPVEYPVAIRISGRVTTGSSDERADIERLRVYADQVKDIIRQSAAALTVRDDWGEPSMTVRLDIDPDRANLAGVTNQDIAISSSTGISGTQVGTLREGDKQIPIVARLRLDQRAQLSDLDDLYVYAMNNLSKVPLLEVASIEYRLETERIRRLEQFRTVTVFSYPKPGFISSDIMGDVQEQLDEFQASLPPGYQMQISGNQANTTHGFGQLIVVMVISVSAIFMALVFQFRNLVKPFLVFAAVPFGMAGALTALYVMDEPFGFMAFLGIVALIGVIVSHIIVLFDFIEVRHAAGDPFREALLDAGIIRLRPILITIAATTLALMPLAVHGGPLWQAMCYAQIGGLLVATVGTLVIVPALYAVFVLDLKWIRWEEKLAVA